MLQKTSDKISNWLYNSGVINLDEIELYSYAVACLLMTAAPIFMVTCIGAFLHKLPEAFFLILPFLTTRKYCGGYHAKTPHVCFVSSLGILILFIELACYIDRLPLLIFLLAVSSISLMINSPIDSISKRLCESDKKLYQKIAIRWIIAWDIISIVLTLSGAIYFAAYIVSGVLLCALLQLPCIIRKH